MNKINTFFSICIPTYNSVKLLDRLIKSILIQTFKNFEVIISDDSTNDNVYKYYKSLNYKNISYYKHKSKISSTENWNFAMKKAIGNYKILIHHDDFFKDNFTLEEIYKEYLSNGNMMVYFLKFINEDNFVRFYYDKFSLNYIFKKPLDLLYVNYFSTPSCVVLNNKVDIVYNENLKWLVDVDFYSRLFMSYNNIKLISNATIVIGGGDERITKTIKSKDILDEFYILTKNQIYKFKIGLFFIKLMKLKIIITHYLFSKFNVKKK